jgi:hypothetical protein
MEPTDLTIEILKDIRDETRKTNERVEALERTVANEFVNVRGEIASVRGEVKGLRAEAQETEVRLATELVAVAGAVREVRDLLREDRLWRLRVDDHERRIAAMERHTG